MSTSKTTAWIASTVAVMLLGYSGYQYREAAIQAEAAARFAQERDKLRDDLDLSEQQAAALAKLEAKAERRIADLEYSSTRVPAARRIVAAGAPVSEEHRLKLERMAQLKPLLEQGTPIKGAVVVMVNGQAVQRSVQFVMGQETRIEATDDGTYLLTPTLNDDGSVKYSISLQKKNSVGGPDQIEKLPFVTSMPWDGFSCASPGGVIAFDPDKGGP